MQKVENTIITKLQKREAVSPSQTIQHSHIVVTSVYLAGYPLQRGHRHLSQQVTLSRAKRAVLLLIKAQNTTIESHTSIHLEKDALSNRHRVSLLSVYGILFILM